MIPESTTHTHHLYEPSSTLELSLLAWFSCSQYYCAFALLTACFALALLLIIVCYSTMLDGKQGSGRAFRLPLLLGRGIGVLLRKLIAQVVVLPAQPLALLLHSLQLPVLLRQLILQAGNFTESTSLGKLVGFLALCLWIVLVALDSFLETESVQYHDIGAVQDEGEEQGKAAEVHVALGVEFAGLDFHPFRAGDAGTTHPQSSASALSTGSCTAQRTRLHPDS